MKIVDIHLHLGHCNVFDLDTPEEALMGTIEKNKIDAGFVQPYPGCPDVKKTHNDIAKLMKKYPKKIFGVVSLNPHQDEKEYNAEVDRLIKDEGFVGIKLHTIGHAINPLAADAKKVFEAAKRHKVPVLIHTGAGIPFALPSHVIPMAQAYADLPIVVYHCGMGHVYSTEAYIVAKLCKNVYLEGSWISINEKIWLVGDLGSERMLLGTDLPENTGVEIFQYKSMNLSDKDLANVLGENAIKLFKLKI